MRDLLRDIEVLRSKVDIVGYQYLSGSNSRRSRSRMDLLGTKIRLLRRVLANLLPEAFKFSLPYIGEVSSFGGHGRFLVEENRHVKLLGKLLAESTCKRNAVVHRCAGYWYEGD